MSYSPENWRALGRYIQRRRLPIESDMIEWAAKVKRSTRTLQGLERGEPQGFKTVMSVAYMLGINPEELFSILETGIVPTDQPPTPQTEGSTNDLLTEIRADLRAMRADVDEIKQRVVRPVKTGRSGESKKQVSGMPERG